MATRSSLLSAYTERLSRLTTVWATQDAASRETVLATESLASAPSQLFQVGTEVNGRYRIEALLGTGGMGRVYRVHDRLYPDRHTALKTLLTDADDSQASLFRSEFQTMASLSHPGIARVYDFERLVGRNTFFFTMELVDGQAIAPVSRQPDWQHTTTLLVQVAQALDYTIVTTSSTSTSSPVTSS